MSTERHPAVSAEEAISSRRSVRRFSDKPVPEAFIRTLIASASRSASGMNMQPWFLHVVTGATRDRLAARARSAALSGKAVPEYQYLPSEITEPYLSRKRKLGFDLYALYGIDKHDHTARQEAMLRNYDLFGAPVGLFFFIDRRMTQGSWLDCGMFMQNMMLLARAADLDTCPQQAWCDVGSVVRVELGVADDYLLLSGMALGHADPNAPENRLVSERMPIDGFVEWHR